MKNRPNVPGAFRPGSPRKSYRLRQAIAEAAKSESAIDLLRELALGQQPERSLTFPLTPRWATATLEAVRG